MAVVDAKEKFGIFKGFVQLLDTKFHTTVTALLFLSLVIMINKNSNLESQLRQDNEKWREREVAMYERILNSPKLNKMEAAADTMKAQSSRLSHVIGSVENTINDVKKSYK